ncbi:MAG: sel1 repeat family protein [Bacteroidaceae bacterium]|nr:sel1 repeat family protein [Bacteroidaceae bacterium]
MKIIITVLLVFVSVVQCYAQQAVDVYTAARAGNVEAQKDLGLLKIQEGNYPEAMSWLRKAAEKGNADAQFNLAVMYRDGEGCHVDYSQALIWFEKAANNIHPRADAYGAIGQMYQNGFGVARDLSKAKICYEKGANMGSSFSMLCLFRIYRDVGDLDNAFVWAKKAADAGDEEAAFKVYVFLKDKDLKTAMKYLKKSADGGNAIAMFWYGYRQMFGEGVTRNEDAGYELIRKAAVMGSEDALDFLSKYKK